MAAFARGLIMYLIVLRFMSLLTVVMYNMTQLALIINLLLLFFKNLYPKCSQLVDEPPAVSGDV